MVRVRGQKKKNHSISDFGVLDKALRNLLFPLDQHHHFHLRSRQHSDVSLSSSGLSPPAYVSRSCNSRLPRSLPKLLDDRLLLLLLRLSLLLCLGAVTSKIYQIGRRNTGCRDDLGEEESETDGEGNWNGRRFLSRSTSASAGTKLVFRFLIYWGIRVDLKWAGVIFACGNALRPATRRVSWQGLNAFSRTNSWGQGTID